MTFDGNLGWQEGGKLSCVIQLQVWVEKRGQREGASERGQDNRAVGLCYHRSQSPQPYSPIQTWHECHPFKFNSIKSSFKICTRTWLIIRHFRWIKKKKFIAWMFLRKPQNSPLWKFLQVDLCSCQLKIFEFLSKFQSMFSKNSSRWNWSENPPSVGCLNITPVGRVVGTTPYPYKQGSRWLRLVPGTMLAPTTAFGSH